MDLLKLAVPIALVAALAHAPAAANDEEPAAAESPAARAVAEIHRLSEAELKEFYLRCARESVRGSLSSGEIAFCSIGYERLLKQTFRGDFVAFLEWRRAQRREQPAPPPSPY
ncbi:MAG TPA: hypothetical protein VFD95_10185 [Usitatibacter sp.]|jgi:hypothetical protein|nr:hypothetical protein [Usitatibacter sp.]